MTQEFGTVVLVAFPFADSTQEKRRPALVLTDAGDEDLLLARVTTRQAAGPEDVTILDWQGTGLLLPSCVRLHKLATLNSRFIVRDIGRLSPTDSRNVADALASLWQHLAR